MLVVLGHVNSMGDYDECVGIRANNVNFSDKVATDFPNLPKTFQGLYCTTYLLPNLTEFQSISENRNGLREALSPSELLVLNCLLLYVDQYCKLDCY